MINLEAIQIFDEILNNYKNVSMESKSTLRDSIFIEDDDDYLNEKYFGSLSKGYALTGIDNYYQSFFKFVDLMRNNVSSLKSDGNNNLYTTPEFARFRKDTEILKSVLNNHFSYNLSSISDYTDDGILKWKKFAEEMDIEVSQDVDMIKLLEKKYIDQAKEITDPLINVIAQFINHVDKLIELDNQLSQTSNKEDTTKKIQKEIKYFNDHLMKNKEIIEHYKSKDLEFLINIHDYNQYRSDIYKCFENIYEKGCFNKNTSFSLADSYVNNIPVSSDILKFLTDKKFEDTFTVNIDVTGHYHNVKVFQDNSMVVVDNENKTKRVFSNMEASILLNTIIKDDLQQTLKKNPVISKTFTTLFKEYNSYPASIYLLLDTYLQNEPILKAQKFNIIDALEKNIQELKDSSNVEVDNFNDMCEYLDDDMNAIVKNHKVKQYAHSIASKKYMHLYDETSYKIIEAIYDLKIESSVLQDNIGRKIAAYHTPDEFNTGLKGLLNTFSDFTPEKIREKAKACHSDIIYDDDNKIIVKIEDFKQSRIMGSSSWCIARDEHYFKSYVGENNHQYFIYDLNKDSSDNESMVGITLTPEIDCEAAHAKNDDDVSNDRRLTFENIDIIVKYDSGWYQDELKVRAKKIKNFNPL